MMYFLTDSTNHLRKLLVNRGVALGSSQTVAFADGERGFRLSEDVRRQAVMLVASVLPDPGSLFDLLAMLRLLRENHSRNPILAIPYLGYARQDRPTQPGEAAIGVMVAELVRNANPLRIRVLDPHSTAILDALGPAAEAVSALPLIAERFADIEDKPEVVVAPDVGAKPRAETLATLLTAKSAYIEKIRPRPNVAVAKELHGDVRGKHILIIDDMIDTGGTIEEAVRLVSRKGALSIRVAATHGIFSKNARDRLSRLPIKEIIVTNSLPQSRQSKIRVLDISSLLLS